MPDTIDVYTMDLDCADPGRLYDLLDAGERDRAGRFRSDTDRRRYIARRGQLRELLARHLGRSPHRISLATTEFGKPFLIDSDLRFNLSHSRNIALIAIAQGGPQGAELGCDIEARDPGFPSRDIAEAFFSPNEARAFREIDAAQQVEAFFNCWTRKEAYIKARGLGVSLPLDSFEVSLAPDEPAALLSGCAGWSVQSFEPRPGFQAAVVAQGSGWQLRHRQVSAPLAQPYAIL
jgi:4'-phosphopantetheinyl transferase